MDYEKKYKEALERAKELIAKWSGKNKDFYTEDYSYIFPELRESEDERIRKELIEFIKWSVDRHFMREDFHQAKRPSEWIAYLEKQNHDGKKWITPAKLNRLETLRYEAGYKAGFNVGVHSEAEKQKEQKSRDYCSVRDEFDLDGNLKQKDHFRDDTKMVEKQDYSSLNDLERAIHRGFLSAGVENAPVTLIKETAKECLEQMKPSEINVKALLEADRLASAEMTGMLKERSEILDNPTKYGLRNPAEWSEEDEKQIRQIERIVKNAGCTQKLQEQIHAWLKSLRPQPHKEIYQAAKRDLAIKFMNYLDENRPEGKMSLSNGECEDIDKAFKEGDWAKIIRYIKKYQPHWKPSEEQPDFPITDEQIKEFLVTHPKIEVPEKYKNPDWLFKKQEQPEVDLEKEIRSMWEKCNPTDEGMGVESTYMHIEAFDIIARRFALWGAEHLKK